MAARRGRRGQGKHIVACHVTHLGFDSSAQMGDRVFLVIKVSKYAGLAAHEECQSSSEHLTHRGCSLAGRMALAFKIRNNLRAASEACLEILTTRHEALCSSSIYSSIYLSMVPLIVRRQKRAVGRAIASNHETIHKQMPQAGGCSKKRGTVVKHSRVKYFLARRLVLGHFVKWQAQGGMHKSKEDTKP